MKITATEEDNDVQGAQTAADLAEAKKKKEAAPAEKGQNASEPSAPKVLTPKKLECSPEQKEKVVKSITAYVQSANVDVPQGVKPVAPAAGAGSDAPKSTPGAPQAAPGPAAAPN
jgi:transposase-like protein